MENRMETTLLGYIGTTIGISGYILEFYRENGKENGTYYNGLHRDYYEDPFLRS